MTDSERKEVLPQKIENIPDEMPQIPLEVENKSIQPQTIPTQVSVPVTDDNGNLLVEETPTQVKMVDIPLTEDQMKEGSKGNPEDSSTWFAKFVERLKKMAGYFGWKTKNSNQQ